MKTCNYCGRLKEYIEDDMCECGGRFIDSYKDEYYSWERDRFVAGQQSSFYGNDGCNEIDNVLEWKRSKSKVGIN